MYWSCICAMMIHGCILRLHGCIMLLVIFLNLRHFVDNCTFSICHGIVTKVIMVQLPVLSKRTRITHQHWPSHSTQWQLFVRYDKIGQGDTKVGNFYCKQKEKWNIGKKVSLDKTNVFTLNLPDLLQTKATRAGAAINLDMSGTGWPQQAAVKARRASPMICFTALTN